MKRIITIALIALSMIGLFAANQASLLARPSPMAEEAMATANQLYEMGHFAQAAQAYQQLADQGIADTALLYNLGNAYFRQENYGRAIVNYRRARDLTPRDSDVKANLELARARTVDELGPAGSSHFPSALGQLAKRWLSLNELAMMALGAWILLMLFAILVSTARAGTVWRKGMQAGLFSAAAILAVGALALGSYLYVEHHEAQGVIVASEVNVSSGPGTQYATGFTLHDGAEVELVESRGSWVRLALPGRQMEGWVPDTAVESLSR
jgi:tetratricopeptide (TPR) repeat protein